MTKIPKIKSPVLFLHGDPDEIVPYEHSRTLYEAAPEPNYRIPGATHNDTYVVGGAEYFEAIRTFVHGEP